MGLVDRQDDDDSDDEANIDDEKNDNDSDKFSLKHPRFGIDIRL